MFGRRALTLSLVLCGIALPAGILQIACVGRSCHVRSPATAVPFCLLPEATKSLLENGFREGRSPDVLGVVNDVPVYTASDLVGGKLRMPWPSIGGIDVRVPIAFSGTAISRGATVPNGTTLDRIAPTLSEVLGFERPFPDVRSGTAIETVGGGPPPSLLVVVAWKGIGTADLEARPDNWPFLSSMLDDGVGTLEGSAGSLPLDPAATLTTIGTGGLPAQHGVTASFVRNDAGAVTSAYGPNAPVSVIATLADDLDAPAALGMPSPFDQRPQISLVATDVQDRGLIGGGWYEQHDRDRVKVARGRDAVDAARSLLDALRSDDAPDVLAVVLDGSVESMDRRTERIVNEAEATTRGSVVVALAGTGTSQTAMVAESDQRLVDAVERAVPGENEAVRARVPGGLFLDQATLTEARVTGQAAVDALLGAETAGGRPMMADAFQGFAVSFARYC